MHEMSIAQAVIDTVLREMQHRGITRVSKIALRIGVWSGVMAEAVQFGYESLRLDTALQHTSLEIEQVGLQLYCRQCRQTTEVRAATLTCPSCRSDQIQVSGGDELDIAFFVAEE